MMNVNVIISGNLTGFSRFYLSPGASEVMAESRFKFDNYDYLSFLKPGGKVYSISFAPKHIAASLITPILDSFRRPGTLVVSVLIPRKFKVEYISGQNSTRALYDLLNALNDRFYEKNYQNGMINQNPAVLMQDYYADILARYTYSPDLRQKDISLWVDTDSLSKKIGYIASPENNIHLYLASLCRRSYDGCHYVFIAPDAPQNINEDPEEVQMYRVRIVNNKMLLPEPVTLTQKIHQFQPGEGEVDFDKNYTYQQVLSGLCQQVSAVLNDEIIEITYRFREKEKKIQFEFFDVETNVRVDISLIRPTVGSGDTKRSLTSDYCIFLGGEIYSRLTIDSTSSTYHIIDSTLDLRYISDGATVRIAVSQGCIVQKNFSTPYNLSKTITIRRNATGEQKVFSDVKDVFKEKIPGQISDWTYEISADGYEVATGYLSSLVEPTFIFKMTPKSASHRDIASSGSSLVNPGAPIIFNGDGPFGGKGGKKHPKGLNWKKIMAVALAAIVVIVGVAVMISKIKQKKERLKDEEMITIVVDVCIKDSDGKVITEDARECGICLKYKSGAIIQVVEKDGYSFEVTASASCDSTVTVWAVLEDVEIQKEEYKESFVMIKDRSGEERKCTATIPLKVSAEDIELCKELKRNKRVTISRKDYREFEDKINQITDDSFKSLLKKLLKNIKVFSSVQEWDERYDHLYVTKESIALIESDENKDEKEQNRIQAVNDLFTYIEQEKYAAITDDLINQLGDTKFNASGFNNKFSQQDAINSLMKVYNDVDKVLDKKFFVSAKFNEQTSFYKIGAKIKECFPDYITD